MNRNRNRRREEPAIMIEDPSEELIKSSKQDPNTTAQSVRKSVNIPNLDLHKINSSEANPN